MTYYGIQFGGPHLEHHGILGMKWGVRRYQNKDGSLTKEGQARYGKNGPVLESSQVIKEIKSNLPDDYKQMQNYKKGIESDVDHVLQQFSRDAQLDARNRSIADKLISNEADYRKREFGLDDKLAKKEAVEDVLRSNELDVSNKIKEASDFSDIVASKIVANDPSRLNEYYSVATKIQNYMTDGAFRKLKAWYYNK